MIKQEEVYKIGLFNKPHGIHGEISFTFTDDIFDQVESDYLICLIDGILVPFYIEEYRFRSENTALIKFEDVNTSEQARLFTNIDVYFPVKYRTDSIEKELSWDDFVGYQIQDNIFGFLGTITEVDTSTINTLFVVGTSQDEILIPAQEELIEQIDSENKIIAMALPEGLINLEDALREDE